MARTLVGRKAESDRARALSDEGDVVHDLLKPGTGNNLLSMPPMTLVGTVEGAFDVEVGALEEEGVLTFELEGGATTAGEVEEAWLAEDSVTTCDGETVAEADGVANSEAAELAAGQVLRRTGRASDKIAKRVRSKITLITREENMSIKTGSGKDRYKRERRS